MSPLKWVSTWRTLTGWARGPDKRTGRDADVEQWLHLKRNGEECCPYLCCDYQIIYNSSLCCALQRCVPLDAQKVGVSEECLLYAEHHLRNQNQRLYWFPGGLDWVTDVQNNVHLHACCSTSNVVLLGFLLRKIYLLFERQLKPDQQTTHTSHTHLAITCTHTHTRARTHHGCFLSSLPSNAHPEPRICTARG